MRRVESGDNWQDHEMPYIDKDDDGKDVVKRGMVESEEDASALGEYWNAVKAYLDPDKEDYSPLENLEKKTITVDGEEYDLVTDPDILKDLAKEGEIKDIPDGGDWFYREP
jgi:hypothetical protein